MREQSNFRCNERYFFTQPFFRTVNENHNRMADTVQYLLEESIPELEDYETKGYFTKSELRQIIQKRQDFEYRLKRRAAMKVDYYRCDSDAAAAPSSCNAD